MSSTRFRWKKTVLACMPTLVVSLPGWAQTVHRVAITETPVAGSGNSGELEEVVVTAQRRSEKLQDVPISVAEFSAMQLANSGITGSGDLPLLTPGLVFGQQVGTAQPFLRGIGAVAAGPGAENPVALYVDNVYYSSPSADYTIPMASFGELTVGTTYAYYSGFYGEPRNRLRQPSYNLLNAQVVWDSPGQVYKLRRWGKNLTNTMYTTAIGSKPNGDFVVYAPPRTYGVTVSRTF